MYDTRSRVTTESMGGPIFNNASSPSERTFGTIIWLFVLQHPPKVIRARRFLSNRMIRNVPCDVKDWEFWTTMGELFFNPSITLAIFRKQEQ